MSQAPSKTFRCLLISPEQTVLDCHALFAVLPAHDGQIGVAANRAPLVCKLGIGAMRVDAVGGPKYCYVEGGFARIRNNELTVLTPTAIPAEKIDRAAAQRDLQQARAMPLADPARAAALARAKTQLALTEP
jgi:F-type H+-transporting ATPase subunit epsilon